MTQDDNLIRMANQIGTFFESMPDREEALEGIATHLKKFWNPGMRHAFLKLADGPLNHEISESVLAAVRAHRTLLG